MMRFFQKRMLATLHHIVKQPTKLSECVAECMNISINNAHDLINLGSVYHKSNSEQIGPMRVMNDVPVETGDYIRVFPDTSRYDTDSVNWKERVLFENNDYIVVNKPPGNHRILPPLITTFRDSFLPNSWKLS